MKLLYIRYSTSDLNTTSQPVSMQEGKSPLFYTVSWRTSVDLVKLSVLVIRKQENTHLQQKVSKDGDILLLLPVRNLSLPFSFQLTVEMFDYLECELNLFLGGKLFCSDCITLIHKHTHTV